MNLTELGMTTIFLLEFKIPEKNQFSPNLLDSFLKLNTEARNQNMGVEHNEA